MLRAALNHLPMLVLLVAAVAVPMILGLVAERVADSVTKSHTEEHRRGVNDMLKTAIGFIGISAAIITGIVVGNQRDALVAGTSNVAAEATALRGMADELSYLPDSSAGPVRTAVAVYVHAEVTSGWHALENGREAAPARAAYLSLGRTILAMPNRADPSAAALQASIFASWQTIGGLRNDRIQIANRRLPPELWLLLVGTGLITVLAVAGLTVEGRADRLATIGAALTVGLIFFAAIGLSYPFSGSISVRSAPIAQAASV
jgi:hypothetical protein